jgi:hypothetical protein
LRLISREAGFDSLEAKAEKGLTFFDLASKYRLGVFKSSGVGTPPR